MQETKFWSKVAASLLGVVLLLILLWQPFKVWSAKLQGEADFSQAEYSRRIKVLEAQATLDSADKLAQAEVRRAHGVAQANQIIGQSLHNNEAYLRYLWIQQIENSKHAVIYVPTEANLPILEANRLPMDAARLNPPPPETKSP